MTIAAMRQYVPNQVFIGTPWKTVKPKYEEAIDRLRSLSPLSFVIVGRGDKQDAKDLLDLIKSKIDGSSYGIFDATRGNANVSLEYGYAEAHDIPRVLYFSGRKDPSKSKEQPIISDLAGKNRKPYKTRTKLRSLLKEFSIQHPYTKRFEIFLRKHSVRKTKGEKKRARSLALKIIHAVDGQPSIRREEVVQDLLADYSTYRRDEIDAMIRALNTARLISSIQGPSSRISIT